MKYKDKLTGKEFTFTPKPNEVMIKFLPDVDGLTVVKSMEKNQIMTPLYDFSPSQSYGCFQLIREVADIQDLSTTPNIKEIFPVVIDDEGNERFFLPGEITAQFKDTVSKEDQLKIISDHNCTILFEHRTAGYYTLELPSNKDIFDMIKEFNALNEILFSEPSNVGYNDALYIPDDIEFHEQWALHNTGQTGGNIDADVDAPQAWNIERGDPDVVVAILDTGVDLDHQDLINNILPQPVGEDWDFADPDLIPEAGPESWEDHGTHCAGIAAATDNNVGIVGLAPGCSILPIRIDLHGGRYQNRADAINFVASIASRYTHVVMSCSWRTSGSVAAIQNAIINANNNNILICFAAGNTGGAPNNPSVMTEVLSVAATDHRDIKASFSSYGSTVDVSAPGVDIYSTVPNDQYESKDGTSMACPLVAGLAGLIWSKNSQLTHQTTRKIIEDNCDNIDGINPSFVGMLGKGRINAYKALKATPSLCKFKILGKFKFPQKNSGSSSALTFYYQFYRKYRFPSIYKPRKYLLFLTQKPYSERIFFLNPFTGGIIRTIDPQKNDTIGSITWDGKLIRVANVTTGSGFINSINPINGTQVDSMKAPQGRGEGMTYDGKYIYYSTISKIYKLNPLNGMVMRSFPIPGGGRCRALTSDGRNLIFAGDPFKNVITIFEKNSLDVVCSIDAPGKGKFRLDVLAYDKWKKILYIANQSENVIYYGTFN